MVFILTRNPHKCVSDYVLRKSTNLSVAEIQALKNHLDSILQNQINLRSDHESINPQSILLKPYIGSDPKQCVKMVKDHVWGKSQKNIAIENNLSSSRIGAIVNKFIDNFVIYVGENELDPYIKTHIKIKKMDLLTTDKFLWYLDHYMHIRGYEYIDGVHIPASFKPIDVSIDDTPLSDNIKFNLKYSGYLNMSEVAKLSTIQIMNLPYMNTDSTKQIMRFFFNYQPATP